MRTGRLRNRIEIEQATEAADKTNHPVKTWARLAYRWAEFMTDSGNTQMGREFVDAKQYEATHSQRIRIWYTAAVTTGMRVKFGSRYFSINVVMHTQERDETILTVTEAV
jgi:SPP1 family predicted phage head-tail adaptor